MNPWKAGARWVHAAMVMAMAVAGAAHANPAEDSAAVLTIALGENDG